MRHIWEETKRRIDVFFSPNRLFLIIIVGLFAFHACRAGNVRNCETDWDGFSNPEICD